MRRFLEEIDRVCLRDDEDTEDGVEERGEALATAVAIVRSDANISGGVYGISDRIRSSSSSSSNCNLRNDTIVVADVRRDPSAVTRTESDNSVSLTAAETTISQSLILESPRQEKSKLTAEQRERIRRNKAEAKEKLRRKEQSSRQRKLEFARRWLARCSDLVL